MTDRRRRCRPGCAAAAAAAAADGGDDVTHNDVVDHRPAPLAMQARHPLPADDVPYTHLCISSSARPIHHVPAHCPRAPGFYTVGPKSKLLILSEYVDNTEKIGGI